jgi:hypothetical protein
MNFDFVFIISKKEKEKGGAIGWCKKVETYFNKPYVLVFVYL